VRKVSMLRAVKDKGRPPACCLAIGPSLVLHLYPDDKINVQEGAQSVQQLAQILTTLSEQKQVPASGLGSRCDGAEVPGELRGFAEPGFAVCRRRGVTADFWGQENWSQQRRQKPEHCHVRK
jgi:hypothetical protein